MKINVRTIFLKSVPYLMSIAGGIILYTGAIDNAPNANIRDLVINVSASLLSIPLVFLLYDYMNSRVARQMRQSIANNMTDKLNTLMLNTVETLRSAMGVRGRLTVESLNRMLMWRTVEIGRRLKITPHILDEFRTLHADLDTLLYRNSQSNILGTDQSQILSLLSRDMARLINENKFRHSRNLSAKYMESMMGRILDWLDIDRATALTLAQHLSATPESVLPPKKKK